MLDDQGTMEFIFQFEITIFADFVFGAYCRGKSNFGLFVVTESLLQIILIL